MPTSRLLRSKSAPFYLLVLLSTCGNMCPPKPPSREAGPAAAALTCGDTVELAPRGESARVSLSTDGAKVQLERRVQEGPAARTEEKLLVDGTAVLEVTTEPQGGPTKVRVKLGARAPEIVLVTDDGRRFQGSVDGQPLEPFERDAPLERLRLKGGGALPQAVEDKQLTERLNDFFRQASSKLAECAGARVPGPIVSPPPRPVEGVAAERRSPQSSSECEGCRLGAVGGMATCMSDASGICAKAAAACTLLFPVCYGTCMGGAAAYCTGLQSKAMVDCHSGGACCPVGCPSLASGQCCQAGETCIDQKQGLCCAAGQSACGTSRCCPEGLTCTDPQKGLCVKP